MTQELRSVSSRRGQDEKGISVAEYGLLVAGIVALLLVLVFGFHGPGQEGSQDTCDAVSSHGPTSGGCRPGRSSGSAAVVTT